MSFEAELRLPAKQQYAYINITVKGETFDDFSDNLFKVDAELVARLTGIHGRACDIVSGKGAPVQVDTRTVNEMLIEELDARVISVEEKPWNREKPAAQEVNFFN